ncbi:MAG TPA: bifunctional demethylmenaquinone methyltransferase/2-methoxy-6-polyprenyl-1,4-benzoquinol methylase UbiE [Opitutaceae bacterium]|jgi:demethylmenaquinone methyltransferase/2-methoxy-6-polyprenyl-1,4-benzoquinol methylase
MPDPEAVNSMFGRIAHRYDIANRLLSLGIDIHWRSQLVTAVAATGPRNVLDLATGSGDVALALGRKLRASARIFGLDFCEPMLEQAEARKISKPERYAGVQFILGDASAIPMPDESFDAVTIAFGFRNFANRSHCLSEILRVLRKGGQLYILEFSQPWASIRPLYTFYMRRFAPALASVITGDRRAYDYLATSIENFPDRKTLALEIRKEGFVDVRSKALTLGIVALHQARRQAPLN